MPDTGGFFVFEKYDVNGPKTQTVYKILRQQSSLLNKTDGTVGEIPWNFCKFLVNGDGKVLEFFEAGKHPLDLHK